MGELEGQVAVVTGGGGGLGRAIALGFGATGADVGVLDLRAAAAEDTATEVRRGGRRSHAVAADVGDETQVAGAMAAVVAALGEVDVLVNCAGIDTAGEVATMPTAMWDDMLRTNLRGVFLCTRAVLPSMTRRGRGRIINISSQLAQKGAATMAHYSAAKAGVIGFTRSLAYEMAPHGVLVNAIAPGPIDTELWRAIPEAWRARKLAEVPLGRPATVEEIVPTAILLASQGGSYYQGATLNPNGGDVMT
ncbi:MAG: SDR family NAD(P)-dependent oxidoreductase [Candidatus Dormiibacterota bacterium]